MKYLFLEGNSNIYKYVMLDVYKLSNVDVIYNEIPFGTNKFLNFICRILLSARLNRYVHIPFRNFLYRKFFKNRLKNTPNFTLVVVSNWFSMHLMSFINKYYHSVSKVLVFRDTVDSYSLFHKNFIEKIKQSNFDNVFCFSKNDAIKFGYQYFPAYVSKIDPSLFIKYKPFDIVFIGHAKNRLDLINKVNDKLLEIGLNTKFIVTGVPSKARQTNVIEYRNSNLSYLEYLSIENASDCIVEIVKNNTDGNTYRCWEAVLYNKKLVTNWKGIFEFVYYDPRYMLYFNSPDDINEDFFRNNKIVDYGYSNSYSPIKIIEKLEEKQI